MALEVSEFADIASVSGHSIQVARGSPRQVHTTTGAKTMGANTAIIAIRGSGSITWPNGKTETFDGGEAFRGVRPGMVITVA